MVNIKKSLTKISIEIEINLILVKLKILIEWGN